MSTVCAHLVGLLLPISPQLRAVLLMGAYNTSLEGAKHVMIVILYSIIVANYLTALCLKINNVYSVIQTTSLLLMVVVLIRINFVTKWTNLEPASNA